MILDYTIQVSLKTIALKEPFDIRCSLFSKINDVEMIMRIFEFGHERLSQKVNNINCFTDVSVCDLSFAVASEVESLIFHWDLFKPIHLDEDHVSSDF